MTVKNAAAMTACMTCATRVLACCTLTWFLCAGAVADDPETTNPELEAPQSRASAEDPSAVSQPAPTDNEKASLNAKVDSRDHEVANKRPRNLRRWTNAEGTKTQEAFFLRLEGVKVFLQKKDGSVKAVPLAKLSSADQEYVARQTADSELPPTASLADSPAATTDAESPANPKPIEKPAPISFTKPQKPGVPIPAPPRTEDLSRLQQERQAAAMKSEVSQAAACLMRTYKEFTEKCRATQLEAVAKALSANAQSYVWQDKQHSIDEQLGTLGTEWLLFLQTDAGIPLETIHRFLRGFDEPSCVVEPAALAMAESLLSKEAIPASRDDTNLPSPRSYMTTREMTADGALAALVFPHFAVRRDHELEFGQLPHLSREVAEILATHKHSLAFPALDELTVDAAAALAKHQGGYSKTGAFPDHKLCLGVTKLGPEAASALARRKGGVLELGSYDRPLQILSRETAEALSQFDGLSLWVYARNIPPESQDALANCNCMLVLKSGPEALASPRLVEKLCRDAKGASLILECNQISQTAATALRDNAGGATVLFTKELALDEPTARILAKCPAELQLHKLLPGSDDVIAVLGSQEGGGQADEALQASVAAISENESEKLGVVHENEEPVVGPEKTKKGFRVTLKFDENGKGSAGIRQIDVVDRGLGCMRTELPGGISEYSHRFKDEADLVGLAAVNGRIDGDNHTLFLQPLQVADAAMPTASCDVPFRIDGPFEIMAHFLAPNPTVAETSHHLVFNVEAILAADLQPGQPNVVSTELTSMNGFRSSAIMRIHEVVRQGGKLVPEQVGGDLIGEISAKDLKKELALPRLSENASGGYRCWITCVGVGGLELHELRFVGKPVPRFGMESVTTGDACTVTKVIEGSDADVAGLKPGDQILEVGPKELFSVEDFMRAANRLDVGSRQTFVVGRRGNRLKVECVWGGKLLERYKPLEKKVAASATESRPVLDHEQPARQDLQPIDTMRGVLSGLEGLAFGMTEEMVRSKVSVPLQVGDKEEMNSEFLGRGDLLQSARFPIMPNETKPAQFVFRNGGLYGVCVGIGKVSPQEFLTMLNLLGKYFNKKGVPAGDFKSYQEAVSSFSEGRPHSSISTTFDNDRVVLQLSWSDAVSASVMELVLKKQEDADKEPFDERMRRMQRVLGIGGESR